MRRSPLALIATAALVAAAGCGGDEEQGDAPTRSPVDLQVQGDGAVHRALAEQYRELTANEVRVVAVPDREEHLRRLAEAFADGRPPDAFEVAHRDLGPFLDDVDPVERRLRPQADAFTPAAIAAFEVDGELQCAPQDASPLVVYVNEDLAGATPRSWTAAELRATAEELQPRLPEGAYAIGLEPSLLHAAPFVWSAGGEVVDDEDAPRRFTLDAPKARRALADLVLLRRAGLVPSATELEEETLLERFAAGKLAYLLGSRRDVPALREKAKFAWDVAPFPGRTSVLRSDGLCLSQGKDADATWEFLAWVAGPEGQAVLARAGGSVPARTATAESRAFLDPGRPPAAGRVFLDGLERARRLPTSPRWPAQEAAADAALRSSSSGEVTLDAALARLARRAQVGF